MGNVTKRAKAMSSFSPTTLYYKTIKPVPLTEIVSSNLTLTEILGVVKIYEHSPKHRSMKHISSAVVFKCAN